jgi:hypothetical protein
MYKVLFIFRLRYLSYLGNSGPESLSISRSMGLRIPTVHIHLLSGDSEY